MITVAILINGEPVMARSAVRGAANKDRFRYNVDDGTVLLHDPDDGAVPLAIKMLETIREPKRTGHEPRPTDR